MTYILVREIIHHVAQISSIVLSFIWFGWQGAVVVFLVSWAMNTQTSAEKSTNYRAKGH